MIKLIASKSYNYSKESTIRGINEFIGIKKGHHY